MTEIRVAHNSTYKKLTVQWLNEALCFGSIQRKAIVFISQFSNF